MGQLDLMGPLAPKPDFRPLMFEAKYILANQSTTSLKMCRWDPFLSFGLYN